MDWSGTLFLTSFRSNHAKLDYFVVVFDVMQYYRQSLQVPIYLLFMIKRM